VPVYGLFRALGDRRRYSTTIFFKVAEKAAIVSVCLHIVYALVAVVLLVILLWRH